jgi:hypothetical protein
MPQRGGKKMIHVPPTNFVVDMTTLSPELRLALRDTLIEMGFIWSTGTHLTDPDFIREFLSCEAVYINYNRRIVMYGHAQCISRCPEYTLFVPTWRTPVPEFLTPYLMEVTPA